MKKSGLADSPFFSGEQAKKDPPPTPPDDPVKAEPKKKPDEIPEEDQVAESSAERDTPKPEEHETVIPRHHDTTTPRHHDTVIPRHHGATIPRYHDTMMPGDLGEVIETIRRELIRFGKEAATHRFTKREKRAIAEIIYAFKTQGLNTSENEIARIAVNFIIDDYKKNGEGSILARALKALNE